MYRRPHLQYSCCKQAEGVHGTTCARPRLAEADVGDAASPVAVGSLPHLPVSPLQPPPGLGTTACLFLPLLLFYFPTPLLPPFSSSHRILLLPAPGARS